MYFQMAPVRSEYKEAHVGAACQGWRAQNARLMTLGGRTCQCNLPSCFWSTKPSFSIMSLSASVAGRTAVTDTDKNKSSGAAMEELCVVQDVI